MAGGTSLGTRLFQLLLLAALGAGGVFGVAEIRQLFLNEKVSREVMNNVIDTIAYGRVNAKKGRTLLNKAMGRLKLTGVKSYFTILSKSDFKELGSYYLKARARGHRNVTKKSARGWRGCNTTDAIPTGTTVAGLSKGSGRKGKKSMMNRLQGIASNDAGAVLSGKSGGKGGPSDEMIVYAVDVFFTYKTLFLKKKLWYHHRCYFHPSRRKWSSHNEARTLSSQ
jgi:hypothetical protein